MKYSIGDIVEIKEPNSFMPMFWNRRFKVIDVDLYELDEELWLVVEVMGEPIVVPYRSSNKQVMKFSITLEGQRDLILVRRSGELIIKSIGKLKIQ
jgi:hypothetical protein